jgi:hypothetical protein
MLGYLTKEIINFGIAARLNTNQRSLKGSLKKFGGLFMKENTIQTPIKSV